jgi:hypothetical protein
MISQLDGWPACAPVNASPGLATVNARLGVGMAGWAFAV